jgi:hypothetical protein
MHRFFSRKIVEQRGSFKDDEASVAASQGRAVVNARLRCDLFRNRSSMESAPAVRAGGRDSPSAG